jgi:hypothetical protein
MIAQIGFGQMIGEAVEALMWFGVGAYLVWFWPQRVRRDVQSGNLSASEADAKLKKFNPRFGYLVMIFGLVRVAGAFLH